MTSKIYVGIDNGLSGAVAFLFDDGVELFKMPLLEVGKKTLIDDLMLRQTILAATFGPPAKPVHVTFEQGQLQPAFGCKVNFSQGYSFGVIATVMRQNNWACTALNPKDWMKEMHLGVRKAGMDTKSASLEACRRLYPTVSLLPTPRCTKPDDGMAEALLMATWAKRHNL